MAVDSAAGLVWERAFPTGQSGPVAQVNDKIGHGDPTVHDKRADTPAMAGVTWANAYFAEFRRIRYDYWPYLLNRPRPFHGRFFNLDGWERKTWEAPGSAAKRPIVWFFGGSALWGEGQRDLHTIPSEVARLAAADGMPIQAHNYGQSGWVMHQEVTLLSELLGQANLADPDLISFYDGANDVSVQAQKLPGGASTAGDAVPSHFGIANAIDATTGGAPAATVPSPPNPASSLLAAYGRNSLLLRGLRGLHGVVGSAPASAQSVDDIGRQAVDKAVPVYRSDRADAQFLASQVDAPIRFFWQPEGFDLPGYRDAPRRVGSPTVDLTGVLDEHRDVFLDLVHTNEAGAALMARAMYDRLRPDLVRWYQQHGGR